MYNTDGNRWCDSGDSFRDRILKRHYPSSLPQSIILLSYYTCIMYVHYEYFLFFIDIIFISLNDL